MDERIAVVSLWAEDVPATARFYQEAIGLRLVSHSHERPHFDVGGCHLTILKGRPIPAQNVIHENFPLFAIAVDDLEAAIQRLQAHQVELPWGTEGDASSRWVRFYDPAGNIVELVQVVRSSH